MIHIHTHIHTYIHVPLELAYASLCMHEFFFQNCFNLSRSKHALFVLSGLICSCFDFFSQIKTCPITWPIGSGDRFIGIYDRLEVRTCTCVYVYV